MVVPATKIRISLPQPQTHLIHVEVVTTDLGPGEHEFFMPVWTPGSYLLREYSRHVESVEATLDGAVLEVSKTAKNRWRIRVPARGDVRLRYRVYARDLSVRTNYVDADRAFWNGAATYILAVERADAPIEVAVHPPPHWRVHAALDVEDGTFLGQALDGAMDAPFYAGAVPVPTFRVAGKAHACVFDGIAEHERKRLAADLRAIVTSAASVFDDRLPYERYLFIAFADSSGSGGLEHANSSVLHFRRASLRKRESRCKVLALFAHEHFHAWNGKRIRPCELATFDYERENYTRQLWVTEGFTSYYQEVIPYRAGLFTRAYFLDRLAANWADVTAVPGRRHMSVAEASFDAWIKLYRPDESTRNTTISYYSKGALVAFCLDLLIQRASAGSRSLDDVMRGLFADYTARGPGQSLDLLVTLVNEAAGTDLASTLRDLVDGTDDPPLAEWLQPFGLNLMPADGREQATLDVRTKVENGLLVIQSVDRGGAGYAMGLVPGDELVAICGDRILPTDWSKTVSEQFEPGQEIEIQLFRRGLLTTVSGRLGGKRAGKARILEEAAELRFR